MILETLDLVEAAALLDHVGDGLNVAAGHLEEVVDAVEDDLDDLGVLAAEEAAEGRDDALLDQVCHLLLAAGDGQVRDGPRGLLLGLEFALKRKKKTFYFSDFKILLTRRYLHLGMKFEPMRT